MKNRLAFLRRRNESPGSTPAGKLDKTMKSVKYVLRVRVCMLVCVCGCVYVCVDAYGCAHGLKEEVV